jgi:hypothetical protein
MLLEHFKDGTRGTITGARIGCEIETDFVDASTGSPISTGVSRAILATDYGKPSFCEHKLELGRQKIELAIKPARSFDELLEHTHASLDWLYRTAAMYGARPHYAPEFEWSGRLLDEATDPRDAVWLQLDGNSALEELCRCSSVQFTIDVNPGDAIPIINALWIAGLHEIDYAANDRRWQNYLRSSRAGYTMSRYGGPTSFTNLHNYAAELSRHEVVMHEGRPTSALVHQVSRLDIELYLRSVWWHYRLRRYNDTLAVEIRPFGRRGDDCIQSYWNRVAPVFGL